MDDQKIDRWIFYTVLGLMAFGIIMVYSSSAFYALRMRGDNLYYLKRQLMWVFLSIMLMIIAYKFPYQILKGRSIILIFLSVGLLVYTYIKGGGRWIHIGPINIQGADVARLSLILFLADSLDRKEKYLKNFWEGFLPHLFYLILLAGLIVKQPDFSSAGMLVLIGLTIMFVSPVLIRYFIYTIVPLVVSATTIIYISQYKLDRIDAFLHPEKDYLGTGYQIIQSLISLGAGGITGLGFAQSNQKMFFLPEAHTDFIYSIIGEEWGLFGTVFILILFFILFWRGISVSNRAPDKFSFYLAFGLTINLVLYGLVNMMVATHLLPPTGLPLPFVSYGGSSMLISGVSAGLLLNISAKSYSVRNVSNARFARRAQENWRRRKQGFLKPSR